VCLAHHVPNGTYLGAQFYPTTEHNRWHCQGEHIKQFRWTVCCIWHFADIQKCLMYCTGYTKITFQKD